MASASDHRAHAALQPADCLILLPQRLPAAVETSIGPAHYPAECTQSDAFLQPSLRARKGRANSNSFFNSIDQIADIGISRLLTRFAEPAYSKGWTLQKLGAKSTATPLSLRAGAGVLPIEAAPDGAARGIALRTAVQSRPPVPGECRRRHGHRHKRIRRQCAARLPRRSISVPSAVTLTRVFADTAIVGVKPFSTASLQYSSRDTRDRYLARRHPDAEALWRQSARAKRPPRRRAHSRRRLQWRRYLAPDHRRRRAAHQHHAARTAALIGSMETNSDKLKEIVWQIEH